MSRLAAFVLLLTASGLHAHSLHQSTAEAEYNAQTKKLEVSLTVFINDLELALIRHSERLMSLDKTPAAELDAQIQSYLAQTFVVTDAAGKVAKIEWVGREMNEEAAKSTDPAVTLFFEIPLAQGISNATIRHTVLCNLFEDQSNLIFLRSGTQKVELRFKRRDEAKKSGL